MSKRNGKVRKNIAMRFKLSVARKSTVFYGTLDRTSLILKGLNLSSQDVKKYKEEWATLHVRRNTYGFASTLLKADLAIFSHFERLHHCFFGFRRQNSLLFRKQN